MGRCNTKFYSSFPGTAAPNSSSLSCKTCKDNNGKPQEVWKSCTGDSVSGRNTKQIAKFNWCHAPSSLGSSLFHIYSDKQLKIRASVCLSESTGVKPLNFWDVNCFINMSSEGRTPAAPGAPPALHTPSGRSHIFWATSAQFLSPGTELVLLCCSSSS